MRLEDCLLVHLCFLFVKWLLFHVCQLGLVYGSSIDLHRLLLWWLSLEFWCVLFWSLFLPFLFLWVFLSSLKNHFILLLILQLEGKRVGRYSSQSVCFLVLFFGEGGGTSVDFIWIVVIWRFFKSLIRLVNFSIYVLDIFILSLRIRIFTVFHSIKRLYSLNHGNPKMISEDPILLMSSLSRHFHLLISVWIHVKCVIFPAWFSVPSTFCGVVKVVLNGVMSELRFKYNGVHMELQGSRLGFNVCVVPSSVKLSVLEFMEVGVGSELDRS